MLIRVKEINYYDLLKGNLQNDIIKPIVVYVFIAYQALF
jgi:hypothetical protein